MLVIRQPIKEQMEGEKYVLPFILKYRIDKVAWIKRFHKEMTTLKQKATFQCLVVNWFQLLIADSMNKQEWKHTDTRNLNWKEDSSKIFLKKFIKVASHDQLNQEWKMWDKTG